MKEYFGTKNELFIGASTVKNIWEVVRAMLGKNISEDIPLPPHFLKVMAEKPVCDVIASLQIQVLYIN